ncbi:MAG: hypothetical protein R2799_10495 [Crocinitomicaceae bacterium]
MVKRLLLFVLLTSTLAIGQRFELGIGLKGNFNWLKGNDEFLTGTIDKDGDTLFMNFDETKINFSYSIPIFVRFRTKFGFWSELNFTTEKLNSVVSGTANYGAYSLDQWTQSYLESDFPNGYTQDIYDQYYLRTQEYFKEQVSYEEVTQYNNIALNFGYTFLRTKKFRPYALLGFEWNSRTNKNHYQSLEFESYYVENYSTIYRKLPRLNSHLFFINIGGGIELYNMQLGFNLRQSVGYAQEYEFKDEVDEATNPYSELYKNITSISFFLKYSLFNFNIKSSEDRKKLKNEELKVLGDFKEKNKLVRLSLGGHVPIYTNVNSLYDQTYPKDQLYVASHPNLDTVYVDENVWIEHYRTEYNANASGGIDTLYSHTFIGLGRVKRISIFPKISFGVEIEPVKYFSYEASLNYQYTEYDTEAKVYEFGYNWAQNAQPYQTLRSTVLRQTLHTISIGQKVNVKYDVSPDVFIGINGGIYLNFIAPGKFRFKEPGYNADPLFEEFDKFIFRGDTSKNWNYAYGGGNPDEAYFYNYWDGESGSFKEVPTNEVMTLDKGRFWMTWTAGFDVYFDRLRISPYVEGKIIDMNFLYRDYFSAGIGFTFYLRK